MIGVGEEHDRGLPAPFLRVPQTQACSRSTRRRTWKLGISSSGVRVLLLHTFAFEFEKPASSLPGTTGSTTRTNSPGWGPRPRTWRRPGLPASPGGLPSSTSNHAFHIENRKLVRGWRNSAPRRTSSSLKPRSDRSAGQRYRGPGFRNRNATRRSVCGRLGVPFGTARTRPGVPFVSYRDTLFCDRAVIGGWDRTSGNRSALHHRRNDGRRMGGRSNTSTSSTGATCTPRRSFPTTMPGRVAAEEPRIPAGWTRGGIPRGPLPELWSGNVVAIGNAAGSSNRWTTALQVICVETSSLAGLPRRQPLRIPPTLIDLYNRYNTAAWDDIRTSSPCTTASIRILDSRSGGRPATMWRCTPPPEVVLVLS